MIHSNCSYWRYGSLCFHWPGLISVNVKTKRSHRKSLIYLEITISATYCLFISIALIFNIFNFLLFSSLSVIVLCAFSLSFMLTTLDAGQLWIYFNYNRRLNKYEQLSIMIMGIVTLVIRYVKHATGQRKMIAYRVRRHCFAKTINVSVRVTMAIIWRLAFVQNACTHVHNVCLAWIVRCVRKDCNCKVANVERHVLKGKLRN